MSPLTARQAQARASSVGASEAGALVGDYVHPYASPASIYARVALGIAPKVTSSAANLGRILEPAIVALAARELRVRVRTTSWTYRHRTLPLVATADAVFLDPIRDDELGLLEAKLVGPWGAPDWSSGPPPWVVDQVQVQLALARRSLAVVAALVGGVKLELYELPADRERQDVVLDAVARFARDHLEPRVPPPAELPRDEDLVLQLAPLPAGTLVASGELLELCELLDATARRRLDAEDAEAGVRRAVLYAIASAPPERIVPPPGSPSAWSASVVTRDSSRHLRFAPTRRAPGGPSRV